MIDPSLGENPPDDPCYHPNWTAEASHCPDCGEDEEGEIHPSFEPEQREP